MDCSTTIPVVFSAQSDYTPPIPPGRGYGNEKIMQASKADVLKRLAYIEGHLKGIRRMVEEDQYCVDVLKQTYAVKRAIDKLEGLLLTGHLNGCVREGFQEGRDQQIIDELGELFDLSRR